MIPSPTLFRPLCVATGSYFLLLLLILLWRGLLDVGVPNRRPVGVFLATIPTPPTAIEANDGGINFFLLFPRPPRLRLVSTCSDRAATCWVSLYLCSQPSLFHFHSVVSSTILTVLTLLIDVDPPKI